MGLRRPGGQALRSDPIGGTVDINGTFDANPIPEPDPCDAPEAALRLRMRREEQPLPRFPQLPDTVELRTYQHSDGPGLRALLETGTFGAWSAERLDALFVHAIDRLDENAVHLALHGGVPIGHCCLMVRDEPEGTVGKLGWVVVHPDWRGKQIGRAVCVAALHDAHRRGLGTVILNTEDFRLAAVRLYLDLGFAPVLGDGSEQDAWWRSLRVG